MLIQHEVKPSAVFSLRHPPSAVFFIHTSLGSALTVILYFLVIWLGAIFSSTQTAATFGHAGTGYSHFLPFIHSYNASNTLFTDFTNLYSYSMACVTSHLLLAEIPLVFTMGTLCTNSLLLHHCLKHLDTCNRHLRVYKNHW